MDDFIIILLLKRSFRFNTTLYVIKCQIQYLYNSVNHILYIKYTNCTALWWVVGKVISVCALSRHYLIPDNMNPIPADLWIRTFWRLKMAGAPNMDGEQITILRTRCPYALYPSPIRLSGYLVSVFGLLVFVSFTSTLVDSSRSVHG